MSPSTFNCMSTEDQILMQMISECQIVKNSSTQVSSCHRFTSANTAVSLIFFNKMTFLYMIYIQILHCGCCKRTIESYFKNRITYYTHEILFILILKIFCLTKMESKWVMLYLTLQLSWIFSLLVMTYMFIEYLSN